MAILLRRWALPRSRGAATCSTTLRSTSQRFTRYRASLLCAFFTSSDDGLAAPSPQQRGSLLGATERPAQRKRSPWRERPQRRERPPSAAVVGSVLRLCGSAARSSARALHELASDSCLRDSRGFWNIGKSLSLKNSPDWPYCSDIGHAHPIILASVLVSDNGRSGARARRTSRRAARGQKSGGARGPSNRATGQLNVGLKCTWNLPRLGRA